MGEPVFSVQLPIKFLALALSPDGRWLSVVELDRRQNRVWLVELDAGTVDGLLEGSGQVWALAFHPHARRLAAAGQELTVWDLQERRAMASVSGGRHLAVDWSPDGRLLATRGVDGTDDCLLYDAATLDPVAHASAFDACS